MGQKEIKQKQRPAMEINELKILKSGQITWRGSEISWNMNFKKGQASLTQLNCSEMDEFESESKNGEIICRWRGHRAMGGKFEVTVIWKNEGGLLSGTIRWKGGNEKETIEQACFPVVNIPMPKSASVYFSRSQGTLIHEIGNELYYPEGFEENTGSVMQFSSLTSPSGSYYFDSRDTKFHAKSFELKTLEKNTRFRFAAIHYLPLESKNNIRYKIPYRLSLGFFHGGWFEAAHIYKKWARRQKWAKRPPVNKQIRNISMWIWNRGSVKDVMKPMEKFAKDSGVPVALDWYWWHQHGYDTSYPHYWPPRDGIKAFKKAVSNLKKQKIFTQAYINGVCWDMDAESWKNGGKESAITTSDGSINSRIYNCFAKRRLSRMCGNSNEPFRKRIRKTITKLRKIGLPGVYLDMIGAFTYGPCYNKSHKHFPGGGNHQVSGYREMLKEIISENPGLLLSTEEANEAYMDLFESAISLSGGKERLGLAANCEPVPAFSAVYHGIIAMFGNYALPDSIPPFDPKWPRRAIWKNEKKWHKLYPDQFFFEVARSVIWGLQPTVANLCHKHTVDEEFKDIYNFLIATSRFYHAHRDFLFDGEMMAPGSLRAKEIEIKFLQRFIFTEEGKQKTLKKNMPAILHSRWKTCSGRIGLTFVNYSRKTQHFDFESPEIKTSGEIKPRSWLFIEPLISPAKQSRSSLKRKDKSNEEN